MPLEVADEPCRVALSTTGLLGRAPPCRAAGFTLDPAARTARGVRSRRAAAAHDVIVATAATTARGTIGRGHLPGRLIRIGVLEMPACRPAPLPLLAGGAPIASSCAGG